MNPAQFIAAKRDGAAHGEAEIHAWIEAFVAGRIGDEQMAAWAMAVYLNGMSGEETAALTAAMVSSGACLARGERPRVRVDKHSTGGVGDKVSIVLAPLLACCDVDVPMLSGRGLGATGGTLDKLESISGFRTDLDAEAIDDVLDRVGCVITGTTADMVPADRKLYALRDVTATVGSIPLMTASILSKKLAEELDALVLDVKVGGGAFMKTEEQARVLANSLVAVSEAQGVSTCALLTDMSQPLGRAVGHALEIDEAVRTLEGEGPEDLVEVTLALGGELLAAARVDGDAASGRERLERHLASGEGRDVLSRMVSAQGGDLDTPRARAERFEVKAPRSGHVAGIDAESLGLAVIELGGGRQRQGDAIDHAVGLEIEVSLGERVERGQPLMIVHGERARLGALDPAEPFRLADDPVDRPRLILR